MNQSECSRTELAIIGELFLEKRFRGYPSHVYAHEYPAYGEHEIGGDGVKEVEYSESGYSISAPWAYR